MGAHTIAQAFLGTLRALAFGMQDNNSSSGPLSKDAPPADNERTHVSGNVRYGSFICLVSGTKWVVDRLRGDLASSGPAMQTYQHVLERLSTLRTDHVELSPLEQGAVKHHIGALEDEVEALTAALCRRNASRHAETVRPGRAASRSSFAPAM